MGRETGGPWARYGCLTAVGLTLIVLVAVAIAVGVAARQNQDAAFEHETIASDGADPAAPSGQREIQLRLEVHTAGVTVKPLAPGESIRIQADYDPRRHELRRTEGPGGGVTVGLGPRGSKMMALLRAKLGGRPAMLRIGLPRGVPLKIEGKLTRSFAMMELGGLSVASADLDVEEGGIKISFVEPLPTPMETLSVSGSKGSLSIVGLGNASPRETRLSQHVGALDLDLRGSWVRDAEVRVTGGVAGGSLWLPDNVRIRGLEEHLGVRLEEEEAEQPLPTLELSLSERMGRVVVID